MPKRKQPKQPKKPSIDEVVEPKTQEKGDLLPPSRRPPTAIAAETPPPPQRRPTVSHFVERLREAVGRVLDLADAAADALTKGLSTLDR